jgi:hypothetical protein
MGQGYPWPRLPSGLHALAPAAAWRPPRLLGRRQCVPFLAALCISVAHGSVTHGCPSARRECVRSRKSRRLGDEVSLRGSNGDVCCFVASPQRRSAVVSRVAVRFNGSSGVPWFDFQQRWAVDVERPLFASHRPIGTRSLLGHTLH